MYWVTSLTKATHGKALMPFSLHSQASRLDQEGPLEIGPEQQEEELNSCTGHELKQLHHHKNLVSSSHGAPAFAELESLSWLSPFGRIEQNLDRISASKPVSGKSIP